MSVLFIGKRFYTNRDALREHYGRIYQLPRHWAQAGIETRLWLVDYHTLKPASEHDGTLEIVSTPVRNLAIIRHWLTAGFVRDRKPSIVVASGDCYIGWLGYRIARRLRARFVFDVYDKYDEFGGYLRVPGFDLFRFLLRRADVRLFASRALMEQLGRDPQNDCLVPNGIDTERFRPLDKDASRAALGLSAHVTLVGYFGGMAPDRGVDDLIAAVRKLRARGSDIELLLGGNARRGMDLVAPSVRHLGNVPYERMPATLASCDLLAVPYRRSAFMDAGASNKIAEAIACRRPLVATRSPNLVANFPQQATALGDMLATPGDVDDLARVILMQAKHRTLLDMPPGFDWRDIAATTAVHLQLAKDHARESLDL